MKTSASHTDGLNCQEREKLLNAVEDQQEKYWSLSDAIWRFAELGLEEYESSKLIAGILEGEGFNVALGLAGLPTAFEATWSNGTDGPVIGFLAEYDALPGLSQEASCTVQKPVIQGAPGHGCGHNTMAAMQSLAVTSLKNIMEAENIHGTIKLFGCPGEEIFASRPFMVNSGLFNNINAVIDSHSHTKLKTGYGKKGRAVFSIKVTFKNKSSCTGNSNSLERNADDAVELMHSATERMQKHLPPTCKVSWSTLTTGSYPNVVPGFASTWYFIRGDDDNIEDLYDWIKSCAAGAALMTRTNCDVRLLSACHQRYCNKVLAELIYQNMQRVPLPKYSNRETRYALDLQRNAGLPCKGTDYDISIVDFKQESHLMGGSDVGDVSLVVPTATIYFPAKIPGSHPHHWTVVSCSQSSYAHKGITVGAKVSALTGFDLMTQPEILKKVTKEFKTLTRTHPYKSYLPEGLKPPVGWNQEQMERFRNKMYTGFFNSLHYVDQSYDAAKGELL